MKPWLRIDYDMVRHPKLVGLTIEQRWGWMHVLCAAKTAPTPGRFASWDHLIECVPPYAAGAIEAYLDAGLLDDLGDGVHGGMLGVHDWAEYQPPGDPTSPAAVRQRRKRMRDAMRDEAEAQGVTGSVTEGVAVGVTEGVTKRDSRVSLSLSRSTSANGSVARAREEGFTDLALLAEELTGKPYALPNEHSGFGAMVVEKMQRHGAVAVAAAMRQAANDISVRTQKPPTVKQLVFALEDFMDPLVKIDGEPDPNARSRWRQTIVGAGTPEQRQAVIAAGGLSRMDDAAFAAIYPEAINVH